MSNSVPSIIIYWGRKTLEQRFTVYYNFNRTCNVSRQQMAAQKIDLHTESIILWTILSIITTLILLLPFILDQQTILQNTPTCISKKQLNIQCIMCGMTRAFIEISNGKLISAQSLNNYSIFLYSIFLLNTILYLIFGRQKLFCLIKTADDS